MEKKLKQRKGKPLVEGFASAANVPNHRVDSALVNNTNPAGADPNGHPGVLAINPESSLLDVGILTTRRLDIRVRDAIPIHGLFSGYLTNSCHLKLLEFFY